MGGHKHQRVGEIREAIRQSLICQWDPVGISGVAGAHDEYDSYVGPVYRLLVSGASDAELIDYFYAVETGAMGLWRFGMRGHLKQVIASLREIDLRP